MEDPPNEPTEQDSTSGQEAIDQDAIDALLKGAAGDDASVSDESADAQPADASQEESKATPGAEGASDSGPKESGTFSQSDIDALLQGAGATDQEASSTQSGGGDASSEQSVQESPAKEPADARVDTLGRPFDEAAAAMQAAMEEEQASAPAVAAAGPTPGAPRPDTQSVSLPTFTEESDLEIDAKRVTMLNDVKLRVRIELGRTRMLVEDVLKLGEGSVVELDKLAGDPVDVYINDRLVARGEVLVLNDNFCVRISDVLSRDPHRISA